MQFLHFVEILDRQKRRLTNLQSQCLKLGLSKPLRNLTWEEIRKTDILVDDIHQVILNAVEKTGCTSWRSLFIDNSPVNGNRVEVFERARYQELGLGTFKKNLLEVAFYKLENYFTILTVRHPLKRLESYFANNLLKRKAKAYFRGSIPSETHIMNYFKEFINNVLTHMEWNYHWNSLYNRSHPCSVDYRYE